MIPMTHYISASSEIRSQVHKLADLLPTEWALRHDWTTSFDEPVTNPTLLAHMDLACAVQADLFIFMDSHYFSRGGMMEYGARLASGGEVYHIGCIDRGYLFFKHQNVRHFENTEELREAIDNE